MICILLTALGIWKNVKSVVTWFPENLRRSITWALMLRYDYMIIYSWYVNVLDNTALPPPCYFIVFDLCLFCWCKLDWPFPNSFMNKENSRELLWMERDITTPQFYPCVYIYLAFDSIVTCNDFVGKSWVTIKVPWQNYRAASICV